MRRLFDFLFAVFGLLALSPLLVVLLMLGFRDTGNPLFRQTRVGKNEQPFILIKFRTMRPDTASVPTHLADGSAVTLFGSFLRKTKLDELPQLWNVLKGEMSLVGPRPCLPTQTELIAERSARGVFAALPGITGLAQVNGVDMSDPRKLAELDARMLASLNVPAYFKYIVLTVLGRGAGDRIKTPAD